MNTVTKVKMKSVIFFLHFAFLIESIRATLRTRIIAGQDAKIKDFPFQASLRLNNEHICGGSILSENHILTAAHCVTNYLDIVPPYLYFNVSTGTSSSRDTSHIHGVAEIKVHPEWKGTGESFYEHDIAVITLRDKINFDENQQKIGLPNHNVASGTVGTLTGWGSTSARSGTDVAEILQKIELTVSVSTDCHVIGIRESQLCAFNHKNGHKGHGSCYGDHGSPLVVSNEVIAILSWFDDGYCAVGKPEIFTNVYDHREFIESVINNA